MMCTYETRMLHHNFSLPELNFCEVMRSYVRLTHVKFSLMVSFVQQHLCYGISNHFHSIYLSVSHLKTRKM
jgi:hypothetical protein